MNFNRSNLLRRATSATAVIDEDLPTSPLSHLIISVSGWNLTDETTLAEILAFMNTVKVSDAGRMIVNLQSEDLYGVNCYLYGHRPHFTSRVALDNQARTLGLIVPFGRRTFDPDECYPARKRGDLKLLMDMTVLATSIDNGVIDIEVVELPDASPSRYLKSSLKVVTAPGATGDNEVRLPIGNQIVALQVRMTTFPGAASHVYGVEDCTVLRSNKEYGYVGNVAQSLVADGIFHVDGQSGTIAASGEVLPDNTIWLDFDPRKDGMYLMETVDASDLVLKLNMGVDETTFVTVLELVRT